MVLVGVSTEQNTANLVPIIQSCVKKVILIETSLATEKSWSSGITAVLTQKKIAIEIVYLNSDSDSNISSICNHIRGKISQKETIVWNLGGGQKPQQFALWQLFNERKGDDKACYANQYTGKLEWWYFANGSLDYYNETLNVNIGVSDILQTFGFKFNNANFPEQIYCRNQNLDIIKEFRDLFKFPEIRELIFRIPEYDINALKENQSYSLTEFDNCIRDRRHQLQISLENKLRQIFLNNNNVYNNPPDLTKIILNTIFGKQDFQRSILTNLMVEKKYNFIEIDSKELERELGLKSIEISKKSLSLFTKMRTSSFYFEQIVISRIAELLSASNQNNFIEAFANANVFPDNQENNTPVAEYDILCSTNKGTLVAYDAKTYDFEKKDSDARLYNLRKIGGIYVEFIPVLPFDEKDLTKPYFSDKLRRLPFKLTQMHIPFYVVSDSSNKDFQHPDYPEITLRLLQNIVQN